MRAANSTKSRRATQRSPRFDHLEDRRLLALSWTSTSLSLFFHDVGATVTPNGDFFVNDTFEIDRSVDQGATWQKVAPASDFSGGAIAYAPSNPSVMIAGSAMGTLKLTDGGSNWFALNDWNGGIGTVKDIVFDAKDENTVYAAVGGSFAGGVFTSTSGGATWDEELSLRDVWAVAPDPADPDVVYAGVRADSTNPGGVLKTTDGGKSWKQVWSAKDVLSLLVDPSDSRRIFAGTKDSGIYESTDGGGTWNQKSGSTIVAPVTALAFDPQSGSHLLAATGGAGVFSSTDGGSTWSADNQGLTDLNVASIGVQSASSSDVLAVTYGGQGFCGAPLRDQLSAAQAETETATIADPGVEPDTGTAPHAGTGQAHPDLDIGRDHAVTRPVADRSGSSHEGAYRRPEAQEPPASGDRAPQAQANLSREKNRSWDELGGPELRPGLRSVHDDVSTRVWGLTQPQTELGVGAAFRIHAGPRGPATCHSVQPLFTHPAHQARP